VLPPAVSYERRLSATSTRCSRRGHRADQIRQTASRVKIPGIVNGRPMRTITTPRHRFWVLLRSPVNGAGAMPATAPHRCPLGEPLAEVRCLASTSMGSWIGGADVLVAHVSARSSDACQLQA
jgi:hypothetical protein